jgi:hypothetical protein
MNPKGNEIKLKCTTDIVWLQNLKPNSPHPNISIPKYKQMVQPQKTCSKVKTTLCLKNHFELIL